MKTLSCLIVDDQPLARELIESYVMRTPELTLIGSCANSEQALEMLSISHVDVLLLDIEMPGVKGHEFYKSLANKPAVIFTTAYRHYAVEGFELEAADYLLKPITYSRFLTAIGKVAGSNFNDCDYLVISENRCKTLVQFSEIVYIHALRDYVQIYTHKRKHVSKMTMSSICKVIPSNLVRVHRSYIVNLNFVKHVYHNEIFLPHIEVPIGQSYRKNFMANLLQNTP